MHSVKTRLENNIHLGDMGMQKFYSFVLCLLVGGSLAVHAVAETKAQPQQRRTQERQLQQRQAQQRQQQGQQGQGQAFPADPSAAEIHRVVDAVEIKEYASRAELQKALRALKWVEDALQKKCDCYGDITRGTDLYAIQVILKDKKKKIWTPDNVYLMIADAKNLLWNGVTRTFTYVAVRDGDSCEARIAINQGGNSMTVEFKLAKSRFFGGTKYKEARGQLAADFSGWDTMKDGKSFLGFYNNGAVAAGVGLQGDVFGYNDGVYVVTGLHIGAKPGFFIGCPHWPHYWGD